MTVVLLAIALSHAIVLSQDSTHFGIKGTKEVGGTIAFESFASVSDGVTGDALSSLVVAPFFGVFLSDGFELGFNPVGFTATWFGGGGGSSTALTVTAAPSYNFVSDGKSTPFIEGLLGVAVYSHTSAYNYGARVGLKNEIAGHALLNIGAEYLATTVDHGRTGGRNGTNLFLVSFSLTAWY
jgi:hypothetical protein